MTRQTCTPDGFKNAIICDEYYSYSDETKGKINGFCFWFADCFDPPIYFVPCDEPAYGREISLQDALESWIDYLYEHKSRDIIGGGYDGSQTFEEYAEENEDQDLEHVTFGASFYAIDTESWQCRQTWIEADCLVEF